jgi:S-adenosylmethionine:tRNA ribosyltransferase-isomerase
MNDPGNLQISDFDYPLPAGKIAQYPLSNRDASRLLVYRDGLITDDRFSNIVGHLPKNCLLVFNNTRVIHARLIFRKPTGGQVEIFCLEPLRPTAEIQAAFQQQGECTWKCLVGNMKRWKSGQLVLEHTLGNVVYRLQANMSGACGDGTFEITFKWDPSEKSFSGILELMGLIPLPPYISRSAEITDNERYQTIYAKHEGSVAAPTAGLHFTSALMDQLAAAGIKTGQVTLHVGVGTFKPVTTEHIRDHEMHHEKIAVSRDLIETLCKAPGTPVFAVGTTSARTLESLYWAGVNIIANGRDALPVIAQWAPYQPNPAGHISTGESLAALLEWMKARDLEEFSGETRLLIAPGYRFRLISGIITNFHMPQSTLLLLIAAMIGENWRKAYAHALQHDYRFLSYGDSCLFFNHPE